MFFLRKDSSKSSAVHLHGKADTHSLSDGESAPGVSLNRYGEGFLDDVTAMGTVGEGAIGFQDHNQSFFQIPFGFSQRSPLGIDTRDLFDGGDVPLAALYVDCGELSDHGLSITVPP